MRFAKIAIGSLLLVLGAAGCQDFLVGDGLTNSPNSPTKATKDQLYAAVVASQKSQQEGGLARVAGMFVQHLAGTGRQHESYGRYDITESDFSGYFSRTYTGGGLIDIRRVQALTEEEGDSTYAGIAKVWEAFIIGTATSIWGDIPYSEAVSDVLTPKLDAQEDVYKAIQEKLDTAIAWIPKTGGKNVGPGAVDLIYGGDRAKWLQAAHTLKARYHMHVAEVEGAPRYALALAAAQDGISSTDADFRTYHSTTANEWNFWHQFVVVQRAGDIGAGRRLVELMKARNDPRLETGNSKIPGYFEADEDSGEVHGADQDGKGSPVSGLSEARSAKEYRQPLITYMENQLIIAEAAYKTGDEPAARVAVNAARAEAGLPGLGVGVTGQALLDAIYEEKYIAMFQNIEAWNDYKRTCYPALTPATGATAIPSRLLYGSAERNANPNIPKPAEQPVRNWNDPNPCT